MFQKKSFFQFRVLVWAYFLLLIAVSLLSFQEVLLPFALHADYRIYQFFTYHLIHIDVFHLYGNMILLLFLVLFLEKFWKYTMILQFFLVGIFFGGLFFLFWGKNATHLIGNSAGISALATGLLWYFYRENYYFGSVKIPYWLLGVGVFLLHLYPILNPMSSVSIAAHLGGFFGGLLLVGAHKWVLPLSQKNRKLYQNDVPKNDEDYNYLKHQRYLETDRILDKISKHGIASLSKEEEIFLKNQKKR